MRCAIILVDFRICEVRKKGYHGNVNKEINYERQSNNCWVIKFNSGGPVLWGQSSWKKHFRSPKISTQGNSEAHGLPKLSPFFCARSHSSTHKILCYLSCFLLSASPESCMVLLAIWITWSYILRFSLNWKGSSPICCFLCNNFFGEDSDKTLQNQWLCISNFWSNSCVIHSRQDRWKLLACVYRACNIMAEIQCSFFGNQTLMEIKINSAEEKFSARTLIMNCQKQIISYKIGLLMFSCLTCIFSGTLKQPWYCNHCP